MAWDDLEVIQTETLGFLTLAGDAKVQLTSRWSDVPSPTAQLLSIASRKGLVAAAGPDAVCIASTDSVRKAFEAPKTGDSEVRPFEPQARLPLPFRISQLAFTADERYLLLSAESGGGLAVYDVQSLADGATKAAFELNTNNESLRCLVPNPSPELAKHCAIVTTNGNLYMANLDDRQLVSGANGPTLRSQVSCAAWSTKGKQLVAGMADGSLYQMTPDGTEKGHIPKPPSLGDYHVGSVSWLENNVFLVVHIANNQQDAGVYHIITRQPGENPSFTFQKLTDPVQPFTTDKVPHHTILRLKDFPPNLQDLLLVSSTATESIGLLTRSKTPLASDNPVTGEFTTTELADDSRRAQLPMSDSFEDTYPIGVALDFSSKNKVYKPIPADEIEESPGPLPGLWVLNNEGVLASWWVVYNDSIRSGTTYPEITATDAPAPTAQPVSTSTTTALPSALSGAFASSSSASQPSLPTAAPNFGSSSFGKPSAFGQPSLGLGAKTSVWGGGATSTAAAPAFGQSGFGSAPGTPGKLFGSGAAASPGTSGGFAGFAKPGNAGGFASFAKPETSGGFASLAKGSGGTFGSGGPASSGASVFGSKSGGAFASPAPEVSMDSDTAFPPPSAKKADSTPSFGSSPFVLGSTWKADPSASNDEKPTGGDKDKSLFGGGFGLSLKDAAEEPAAESKDEDMDAPTPAPVEKSRSPFGIADQGKTPSIFGKAEEKSSVFGTTPKPEEQASSVFGSAFKPQENTSSLFGGAPKPQDKAKSVFDEKESTTPTATPAPQKFDFKSASASTGSNLFGTKPPASGGSGGLFGTGYIGSGTQSNIFGSPPKVKTEEEDDEVNLKDIPEAPLPPDTTTLQTPTKATDAPLPPDFLSKTPAVKEEASTPADETPLPLKSTQKVASDMPLPPDFLAKPTNESSFKVPPAPSSSEEGEFSDEEDEVDEEDAGNGSEGSGVDVAKDLSPTSGFPTQTPGFTPQSSFGGMAGSAYSTISRSEVEGRPSLFGEIKNAPPLFPKPGPLSPRSPSPVRSAVRPSIFRDSARSVSAPGLASQFLGKRSQQPQSGSGLAASMRTLPVDPNVQAQRKLAEKREAEERMLFDPEDEGIQQILHSEVEPTLHMNEFLVVDQKLELDDRLGREDVPVHCEALWRDINRMIDKLGLNSRSLKAFILGHSQYHEDGRHKEDLENDDDWILVEAKDLGEIIDDELAADLEDGRLKDIEQTEAAIHALARDLVKLRAKEEDIRRLMLSQTDPDQVAISKSIPLSAEQSAQQNELRRAFLNFSNLLAEAEEALTMLKTKLASAGGPSGKAPVPTVEAIIRTINKMTTMAEKRSGDIDVLENQMRRLRFSSVGLNGASPARSREGSPFVGGASLLATPSKRASLMSPERMMRESTSSPGPYRAGTPRKKVSMFTEEEKKTIRAKADKRKAMLNLLATSLEKAGPNVSRLRDDD
ncbi:hypothetical protein QBC37DRAFT_407770 [Rhypophila decipiens]|uniref:Nucleoporin Nup159/Nup146 N-terminal domain-containing protein n=1 Tax=Rhypophila decipiens TaxID=261697 RepID=A0AAN6YKH2_9PEZI|nr:hypothetical protein QBC37DRAFT_407770 [Rhypophila decipiens]